MMHVSLIARSISF